MVSVIIPCFNQGRFLHDALSALQAQTYGDWEAIVIDDGSLDDTAKVASQWGLYDKRIRYIYKENGGLSSARNIGLDLCKGEYIQFLDADDLLEVRKLEAHVNALRHHSKAGIVYGNAKYFVDGDNGNFIRGPYAAVANHDWISEAWNDPRPMLDKFSERNLFPVCAPLLRRSVIDTVGLFSTELEALEDWDYWLRCAISGVVFCYEGENNTDALVRMHLSSMSAGKERMMSSGCLMRIIAHEQLPLGSARDKNLMKLLVACTSIGGEERAYRFRRIYCACRTRAERALVKTSQICDPGGELYPVAYRFGKLLPETLRSRLIKKGLQFPAVDRVYPIKK